MRKVKALVTIIFLSLLIVVCSTKASDCDSCVRKIQVKIYNESDMAFDTSIFLRHFGWYFRSPCVQLGENLSQPEYVVTATFIQEEEYKRIHLGIILGFIGGKIGSVSKQREWWTQTYYNYFGDMISIVTVHTEGDSLDDVVPLMLEKLKKEESIDLTMRRYEQIPQSAETEDNLDCDGGGWRIKLHNVDSGYPRYGFSSSHDNRIVVHTENGTIKYGEPLEEDDRYKVFERSANLGPGNPSNFSYEPPEGDDKSDTIIFYNSCDILHEDVLPLSKTKKNVEIARVELRCIWEGMITSNFKLSSSGGESLLTALMPKSSYKGKTYWKLGVGFKLDRGNERVKIYKLKEARFSFSDELEGDLVLEGEAGKTRIGGEDRVDVRGRRLSPSECELELIIDLKKKTYKIEGLLDVKNISEKEKGELDVDMPPIQHREKDSNDQTIDYREEILIEGKFKEDGLPEKLAGSIDEIKELPDEFEDFMEAFAGKLSGKIHWKLEWKGK